MINCDSYEQYDYDYDENKDEQNYYKVNYLFPLNLSSVCSLLKLHYIHLSNDNIFSGLVGNYNEDDTCDNNTYALSKNEGDNCKGTIIRTCLIGEELYIKNHFLEWLKKNKNKEIWIEGNHYLNPITYMELIKIIGKIIEDNLYWNGIRHIYSSKIINKYELANIINTTYELDLKINKIDGTIINKSLTSKYENKFQIKKLKEQLIELKKYDLTNRKDVIFLICPGVSKFYDDEYYLNLFSKYYNVKCIYLDKKYTDYKHYLNTTDYERIYEEIKNIFESIIDENVDKYFIFTSIVYYYLLLISYFSKLYFSNEHTNKINVLVNIFLNMKYIYINFEIYNHDLDVIGFTIHDRELLLKLNKNSIVNYHSCINNINILNKYNVFNSVYIPILYKINENIDYKIIKNKNILIYESSTERRKNKYEQIKNILFGYNVFIFDDLYGNELNEKIKDFFVVLHIGSYENLEHMCWAKIMFLVKNKVPVLIEENNEFKIQKMICGDICFKKDLSDLKHKVDNLHNNIENTIKIINNNYFNFMNKIYSIEQNIVKWIKYSKFIYVILLFDNLIYSSHIFYDNMMKKIKKLLDKKKITCIITNDMKDFIENYNDSTYIKFIDINAILQIFIFNKWKKVFYSGKYILIIGENYDTKNDCLIGWDNFNITFSNYFNELIKNSYITTYQNIKIMNIVKKINDNKLFLPIDGYVEDDNDILNNYLGLTHYQE